MQVNAILAFELIGQELDQAQVEILTTQEGITVRRKYFELMLTVNFRNLDDGDIEGAAAKIVDRNRAIALGFVHAVGKCRRRWLVNDSLYFKSRDTTSVFRRLTLRVVEIGRNCDHGFGY